MSTISTQLNAASIAGYTPTTSPTQITSLLRTNATTSTTEIIPATSCTSTTAVILNALSSLTTDCDILNDTTTVASTKSSTIFPTNTSFAAGTSVTKSLATLYTESSTESPTTASLISCGSDINNYIKFIDMTTTPSIGAQSQLPVVSQSIDAIYSTNMLPVEVVAGISTTTALSSSLSTNMSTLSAPSATSNHVLLNSLVSVDSGGNTNQTQQQAHQQILADDRRALQLALELSMVGLNDVAVNGGGVQRPTTTINHNGNRTSSIGGSATLHLSNYQHQQIAQQHQQTTNATQQQHQHQQHQQQQQQQLHQQFDISTLSAISAAVAAAANATNNNGHSESNINGTLNNSNITNSNSSNNGGITLNQFAVPNALLSTTIDERSKKSQNMTECVPVPSSEHVAEIVGRQGCKIKALRAKTNTYIKTPVRGEEPVFVVTGRKEDVAKAKREILSAAEHFSLIRATRKPSIESALIGGGNNSVDGNNSGANGFSKTPPGPPSIPGQVTIQVRVPYRVVGLVVGPKGGTIKHIQHQTQTYIVTPSREKEPIFEVTGLPDNVQLARKQIEAHIALRTGNLLPTGGNSQNPVVLSATQNDTLAVHSLTVLSQILNDATLDPDLLVSLYKADGMCTAFDYMDDTCVANGTPPAMQSIASPTNVNNINFNMSCLENNTIANQPFIDTLSTCNNFQLQNLDTSHQNSDYVNNLINNCGVVGANGGSEIEVLTDLEVNQHIQQHQQQHVYPVSQAAINIRHQVPLVSTAATIPIQNHAHFVNNIATYTTLNTQTINTTNNTTAISNNRGNSSTNAANTSTAGLSNIRNGNCNMHTATSGNGMAAARSCSSASSTASSKSANNSGSGSGSGSGSSSNNSSRPELINIWKNLGDSLDVDEGIGDSPNIWTLPTPLAALTGSHCSPTTSISPTDSLLGEISAHTHHNNIGLNSIINGVRHEVNSPKNLLQQQNHLKNGDTLQTLMNNSALQRRECLVCNDKEITAALVPCGHNMFCMECANRICDSGDATCPICSLTVYHAMRILA